MKKFCLIANTTKRREQVLCQALVRIIEENGGQCLLKRAKNKVEGEYHYTNPEEVDKDVECVIVLGGDGTVLQAARDLRHLDIPFLGVNLGHLGFLAVTDETSAPFAVERLMDDRYEVEERMMLSGTVMRGDEMIGRDVALNDIVITREGNLRIITLINYVNGQYLNSYNADGIIISTPTGSTGYSMSVGGPIVSPSAKLLMMTPVAAHTLNARSLIFGGDAVLTVQVGENRHGGIENAVAYFDGDVTIPMKTGDRIVVRASQSKTRLIKLDPRSFVQLLRLKMKNVEDNSYPPYVLPPIPGAVVQVPNRGSEEDARHNRLIRNDAELPEV